MINLSAFYSNYLKLYFEEDELGKNLNYLNSLPSEEVHCLLKIKDDLCLAGLPFFFETFNYISQTKRDFSECLEHEGSTYQKTDQAQIEFKLPFNIALSAERIALNLLQRASSVATYTRKFVDQAQGVKILDTRKTTPGLRYLEKYAVAIGGGTNHRFSQTDVWMIKDNHKKMWGGVKPAIEHFLNLKSFYQEIIVEIHDLAELEEVRGLGVKHFMLDNFSHQQLKEALSLKAPDWTYEVSGGVNLKNLSQYTLEGVDAISTGSIVYNAPQVDLSLKIEKC